ncbi:hypothetical protein TSAR_004288 [Trichomalopsis sarcophagae]|uniref:Small ribosomal subunit protein eS21 n=1 Tax=Trichomalopsis sarcophagae TaxID=543379 RepID=A0A232F2N6_9HYME|nr:hypothetical protein TSAR_004288 [Trichomalopsis sarcophagae]
MLTVPLAQVSYARKTEVESSRNRRSILSIYAPSFPVLPRRTSSSASNRIIHAKDHASIQMALADVDPTTGRMTDTYKMYAICGAIRRMGESDDCIVRLGKKDGILAKNY